MPKHETTASPQPGGLPGTAAKWERAGFSFESAYPFRVTKYYAGLVRQASDRDPVALQAVPRLEEQWSPKGVTDPLGEGEFSPLPGLVHVYADRVLLMPTGACAVNCRHCNRRWTRVARHGGLEDNLPAWLDYLRGHREVREVLVTGGDPVILAPEALELLLGSLRRTLPEIVLRVGSRIPVVQPSRVTARLARIFRSVQPLYLHTQFNCYAECTTQAAEALRTLADAGVNLGNQMVLLKGVNDRLDEIVRVNRWLVRQRCRPYYLFYPEAVAGTAHFRPSLRDALTLGEALPASCSGLATPTFVVDTPDGGGKVPLQRGRLTTRDGVTGIMDLKDRWMALD